MRSWVRDLRRLVVGLGMTPALVAELHRTAKIRSDWFDAMLSPPLLCFAQVLAALDQTEDASHANQGHLQVAHLIARIDTAVRGGEGIEALLTEFTSLEPARIAAELIKSVGALVAEAPNLGSELAPAGDRTGKQHSSADRDAQENQHEQTEADRKRDPKTS